MWILMPILNYYWNTTLQIKQNGTMEHFRNLYWNKHAIGSVHFCDVLFCSHKNTRRFLDKSCQVVWLDASYLVISSLKVQILPSVGYTQQKWRQKQWNLPSTVSLCTTSVSHPRGEGTVFSMLPSIHPWQEGFLGKKAKDLLYRSCTPKSRLLQREKHYCSQKWNTSSTNIWRWHKNSPWFHLKMSAISKHFSAFQS